MIESWGTTQELTGCREKQVALAGRALQGCVECLTSSQCA
jgi:hypothetical protein